MAKFYTIEEIAESLCLRSGDIQMRNKGLFMDCGESTWIDLNEDVLKISSKIKIPVRYEFFVDKRTNSVAMPKNSLRLASIHSVDRNGCYTPVYRNDSIETDIVDLGEARDCECEHNCANNLCHTIKGYEAVTTVKSDFLPNGDPISFTCIDKKMVDSQGFLYSQTQYPLRVYISGVWTDTIKYTEDKKLCSVELDSNGCVCDTEQNLNAICNACGIDENYIVTGGNSSEPPICYPDATAWRYHCASKMEWFNIQCGGYPYRCGNGYNNIYNISQDGKRIIFPYNFGWDKVMIRFYEDISLNNIQVPYLAKECFMTGMQYFATTNHEKKQNLAAVFSQKYSRQKWGLLLELNKNTIAELSQIFTPKVFVPSYLETRNYNDNHYGY